MLESCQRVSQGRILGALLFIIYPVEPHYQLGALGVSFKFFADDTKVYFTMDDLSETKEKLTQVHDAVCYWIKN